MTDDLHPERALDQLAAGTLSEEQRTLLDRHLATCLACRAQLALANEALTSAQPRAWDGQANRLAIDSVLARVDRRRAPLFFGKAQWSFAAAATLLAFAGVAAAARHYGLVRLLSSPSPSAAQAPPSSPQAPLTRAMQAATAQPNAASSAAPDLTAALAEALPAPEASKSSRLEAATPSAAALFAQGSKLQARGDSVAAIGVFRRLQSLHPSSRETSLSFALVGRMLLGRARFAAAVSQFDRYLARGGEASEEALVGRATALGKLGRRGDERATWQRLLSGYPRSVYAGKAAERLSLLDPVPTPASP